MAALAASSSARPPGHSQLHRLKISNPKISSWYFSMQNILKEEIIWKCRTCLVHFFRHNCWSYFVSSRFLSLHLHHSLYFKFSFFDDFSFLRVNPPSPPQSNYAKNTWGLILLLIIPLPSLRCDNIFPLSIPYYHLIIHLLQYSFEHMTFGILKDHKQFKIGPTLCHHFYLFSKCSKNIAIYCYIWSLYFQWRPY